MDTVFHETIRGTKVTRYSDDKGSFGFCGRAAYAMGLDRPNYPVPAIRLEVDIRIANGPYLGYLFLRDVEKDKDVRAWRSDGDYKIY